MRLLSHRKVNELSFAVSSLEREHFPYSPNNDELFSALTSEGFEAKVAKHLSIVTYEQSLAAAPARRYCHRLSENAPVNIRFT